MDHEAAEAVTHEVNGRHPQLPHETLQPSRNLGHIRQRRGIAERVHTESEFLLQAASQNQRLVARQPQAVYVNNIHLMIDLPSQGNAPCRSHYQEMALRSVSLTNARRSEECDKLLILVLI